MSVCLFLHSLFFTIWINKVVKNNKAARNTFRCTEGHGFNSRRGLRFFFVPRSRHVDYSIFSYFFSELKIHHLSLFITNKVLRHCWSKQYVTTNSVNMTYARCESPSSSVVRASDWCMEGHGFDSRQGLRFFFVPHSQNVDYSIFSYFFSGLKIHHLSLFNSKQHKKDISRH